MTFISEKKNYNQFNNKPGLVQSGVSIFVCLLFLISENTKFSLRKENQLNYFLTVSILKEYSKAILLI